jgi:hypothetical protein
VKRYKYEHPDGSGLGRHVRDTNEPDAPRLEDRSAAWSGVGGEVQPPRGSELTMADLDMPDGTIVELAANDDPDDPAEVAYDHERDLHLVDWVDRHGNTRRTSITPEFFSEYFTEVTA